MPGQRDKDDSSKMCSIKDYSVRDGNEVKCQCGNLIGIVEGKWIKMKQNSFTYSGARTRK
jgi:hypothetical protein